LGIGKFSPIISSVESMPMLSASSSSSSLILIPPTSQSTWEEMDPIEEEDKKDSIETTILPLLRYRFPPVDDDVAKSWPLPIGISVLVDKEEIAVSYSSTS